MSSSSSASIDDPSSKNITLGSAPTVSKKEDKFNLGCCKN